MCDIGKKVDLGWFFHGASLANLQCYSVVQEHRGLLSIRYPMEHGIVRDWNDMERIWQYIYSKEQLQTFSEEVKLILHSIFLCTSMKYVFILVCVVRLTPVWALSWSSMDLPAK
jgi:Actin